MTEKVTREGYEYIKLEGEHVTLAKELHNMLISAMNEEKEAMQEFENKITMIKAGIRKKRREVLTKVLLDLGYDATKADGSVFDIHTGFADFGIAILLRNINADEDSENVFDPFSTITGGTKH